MTAPNFTRRRQHRRPPPWKQRALDSPHSFEVRQEAIAQLVEERPDRPRSWKRLHLNAASLDTGRRSAACNYERWRTHRFANDVVLKHLEKAQGHAYLVTVAAPKWRRTPGDLKPADLSLLRRKVRDGHERLRARGYRPAFLAVIEVSAARDVDGSLWFEPHLHIVIKGIRKPEIRNAFQVRIPRSDRQRIRPVQVKKITSGSLGTVLGYVTKMKAELRSGYERADGTRSRRTNRMPPDLLRLWLGFMALIQIEDLLVFGGFSDRLAHKFLTIEMATLEGEF